MLVKTVVGIEGPVARAEISRFSYQINNLLTFIRGSKTSQTHPDVFLGSSAFHLLVNA